MSWWWWCYNLPTYLHSNKNLHQTSMYITLIINEITNTKNCAAFRLTFSSFVFPICFLLFLMNMKTHVPPPFACHAKYFACVWAWLVNQSFLSLNVYQSLSCFPTIYGGVNVYITQVDICIFAWAFWLPIAGK